MQAKPADNTVSGAFARRLGPSREARLGAAVLAIVGRAHDLLAELKPTPAEFRALVDFLTELGHASDARRQEWVLLADVTGLSTLDENQDPDRQPEFNLRGRLRSDAMGRLSFRSVKPRGYALPEDGPVGRLMSALGLRLERPAHIHFKVTAPGFRTLVTHVFDRNDPAIRRDALFGVRPELLAEFCRLPPGGPARHALDLTLVLLPAAEEIPR